MQLPESAAQSLSGVLKEPGLCFEAASGRSDTGDLYIPIDEVLKCLRKVKLNTDFAVEAVEAYNDVQGMAITFTTMIHCFPIRWRILSAGRFIMAHLEVK